MTIRNECTRFRKGEVPLSYRATFRDNGKQYASLYAGEHLIATDVLLGDAQALCELFNHGCQRTQHYRDLAARVRAAK